MRNNEMRQRTLVKQCWMRLMWLWNEDDLEKTADLKERRLHRKTERQKGGVQEWIDELSLKWLARWSP